MNGVSVKVVGSKLIVEVDILRAIAERRQADQQREARPEAEDSQHDWFVGGVPLGALVRPRQTLWGSHALCSGVLSRHRGLCVPSRRRVRMPSTSSRGT